MLASVTLPVLLVFQKRALGFAPKSLTQPHCTVGTPSASNSPSALSLLGLDELALGFRL